MLAFSNLFLACCGMALFFQGVASEQVPVEQIAINPKLIAHQESIKALGVNGDPQKSTVTITVGEKNGFAYTANGETYSPYKIAVSGEYLNDEVYPARGFTRIFLVVESGVAYYALKPSGNILDVYVQNRYGAEFLYEILCPPGVAGYNLWEGQINATAVLITGPSRSQVSFKGGKRNIGLTQVVEKESVETEWEEVKDRRRRRA